MQYASFCVVAFSASYFAPPQTAPVVFVTGGGATLGFFFIVIDVDSGAPLVLSGDAATASLRATGVATSCKPDKYGFYRNCLVQAGGGVYFAGQLASSVFEVIYLTAWNAGYSTAGYNIGTSVGASDFTLTGSGAPLLGLFSWRSEDDYVNDFIFIDLSVASVFTRWELVNGTHILSTATSVFWKTISDWDPATATVKHTFYKCDGISAPVPISAAMNQPAFKVELGNMFLPFPFYVRASFLYFTDWGMGDVEPSIKVYNWMVLTYSGEIPRVSIGWPMFISDTDAGFVGIGQVFSSAYEFVYPTVVGAWRYATGSATAASMIGNDATAFTSTAFAVPGAMRFMWGTTFATGPPHSFQVLNEWSGTNYFSTMSLGVSCAGINPWTQFVRFQPIYNGSHVFFLSPGAGSATVYSTTASGFRTSPESMPMFFYPSDRLCSMRRNNTLGSLHVKNGNA